jgi:hypothetical protein
MDLKLYALTFKVREKIKDFFLKYFFIEIQIHYKSKYIA